MEDQAIREVVAACAKAYNAQDAKSLAGLFTLDVEIVSEEGHRTHGRQAIEQVFSGVFAQHPRTRLQIAIESIRFLCPTVAIEEGTTLVTHEADQSAEHNRYRVVHVQQDGRWQMASARDLPDEATAAQEELQQLEWLLGDWVDESHDGLVLTSYRWTDNHRYILGEFTVQREGRPLMTGSQRIGWDPLAKQLRSWVFDSEGGFFEGLWTRADKQWIVKMTGVTRHGKVGSSTNITSMVNKDRMTWESRDRLLGAEKLPDIEAITIVRKPPQPK